MRYLTPDQYRAADDGVASFSTSHTDQFLARMIARAEEQIDSYMGFDPTLGGFDPHVIFHQRGFDLRTRKWANPQYPVPIRNIVRYRLHISNTDQSGQGFYATISPGDAVINQYEGYVEIVPLDALTYSMTPAIYQLGLNPPLVEVDAEVGYFIPKLGVRLYNDTQDGKTYRAPFGFWASEYTQAVSNRPATLPPVPPVIYLNGSPVDQGTTPYTLDFQEGVVVFSQERPASDSITLDATATIPERVTWAATAQTTWLLGQRTMTQMGGRVLEMIQSGEQQVRRHMRDVKHDLCDEAIGYLRPIRPYAMA
jgi:hypothetical protein